MFSDMWVQVVLGKGGDKMQGLAVADMHALQDQIRASFEGIRDLKQRLDVSEKHSAWCACAFSLLTVYWIVLCQAALLHSVLCCDVLRCAVLCANVKVQYDPPW